MAELDPAIHRFRKEVDARVKPAHDVVRTIQPYWSKRPAAWASMV